MPKSHLQIFLADDSQADGTLLREAFADSRLHAEVIQVFDGASAWDALASAARTRPFPYVVILVDLNLPRLKGLELLTRINGNPVLAAVPRAVITGSTNKKDRDKAMALDANLYLIKPDDYRGMMALVRKIAALLPATVGDGDGG